MSSKKKIITKIIAKKRSHKKKVVAAKKPSSPSQVSYTITDNSLTVNYCRADKKNISYVTKSFDKGTVEYSEIKKAIVDGKLDLIPKIAAKVETSIGEYTAKFKEKFIKLDDGVISIDGKAVGNVLSKRIVKYAEEGLPYMDLVNFHRKLMLNPSYTAVVGLFEFLDANHFPLTPSGDFIAYKGVSSDYKDLHTGTMDNSPGKIVKMERNQVDEDPNVSCSRGLHTSSYIYAHSNYGSGDHRKVINLLINPKDVVAVPRDYNAKKMRVCEYKVLGDSTGEIKEQRVEVSNDNDDHRSYEEMLSDHEDSEEETDSPWPS